MSESASIKVIELTRKVFEFIHGNLGLLKFNVEELKPINGTDGEESKIWEVTCSFYETLGSEAPTKYKVLVDLEKNTVSIKKISGEASEPEHTYTIVKKTENKDGESK
jgi:hypothetical protein